MVMMAMTLFSGGDGDDTIDGGKGQDTVYGRRRQAIKIRPEVPGSGSGSGSGQAVLGKLYGEAGR